VLRWGVDEEQRGRVEREKFIMCRFEAVRADGHLSNDSLIYGAEW